MALQKNLSSLFKANPIKGWKDVSPLFGDVFFDLEGSRIERGQKISTRLAKEGLLPAVLDSNKCVLGDLIPHTSWGSSLANMLTQKSWNGLRHPIIQANNNICELCGGRFSSLDVHEVWMYDFPPPHEMKQRHTHTVFGVQQLVDLMAICTECHRCFHLGREKANNTLDKTLHRLKHINGWSQSTLEEYYTAVANRWEKASEISWLLDLSRIAHPEGGLTVKSPWKNYGNSQKMLTAPSQFGSDNMTMLLNTPWKFAKERDWRPAITLQNL